MYFDTSAYSMKGEEEWNMYVDRMIPRHFEGSMYGYVFVDLSNPLSSAKMDAETMICSCFNTLHNHLTCMYKHWEISKDEYTHRLEELKSIQMGTLVVDKVRYLKNVRTFCSAKL